jgi:HSP20 family protein
VSTRDLFGNFDRMRREMDELLGGVFERTGMARRRLGFSPPVDVAYTTEPPTAIVTFEVAGVDPRELDLEIHGRRLILAGRRPGAGSEDRVAGSEDCVYQQVEIERGPFRRVITLAADAVAEQARADYRDGMLRIEVPLRVAAGARTVPVKGPKR